MTQYVHTKCIPQKVCAYVSFTNGKADTCPLYIYIFPTLCCAFVTRILIDCSNRFLHPVKSLLYNAAKGEQEGMWIVTHG